MRVRFVASGSRQTGGARIRAWDVVKEWDSPEVSCLEANTRHHWSDPDCDVVVLQKIYPDYEKVRCLDTDMGVERLRSAGVKVYWDLCDPIWANMKDSTFLSIAGKMSGIVVSNHSLRDLLFYDHGLESTIIEDRFFPTGVKEHTPHVPATLVWFGHFVNRENAMQRAGRALSRLNHNSIPFELTIVDNKPEVMFGAKILVGRLNHVRWSEDTFEREILLHCDIALLPRIEMKSWNKVLLSSWLGLPVSTGDDYRDLRDLLLDADLRARKGREARAWAEEVGHIAISVAQWKNLIEWREG